MGEDLQRGEGGKIEEDLWRKCMNDMDVRDLNSKSDDILHLYSAWTTTHHGHQIWCIYTSALPKTLYQTHPLDEKCWLVQTMDHCSPCFLNGGMHSPLLSSTPRHCSPSLPVHLSLTLLIHLNSPLLRHRPPSSPPSSVAGLPRPVFERVQKFASLWKIFRDQHDLPYIV